MPESSATHEAQIVLANLGRPRRSAGATTPTCRARSAQPHRSVRAVGETGRPVGRSGGSDRRAPTATGGGRLRRFLLRGAGWCRYERAEGRQHGAYRTPCDRGCATPMADLDWRIVGLGSGSTPRRGTERARTRPVAAVRSPRVRPALLRHYCSRNAPLARRGALWLARGRRVARRPPPQRMPSGRAAATVSVGCWRTRRLWRSPPVDRTCLRGRRR